jgi:hypothetical protein
MIQHDTILAIMRGCVDISPSYQPDRALSALNSRLTPNCNLSQSRHGHMPIACAHTTGNSNTYLSQVSGHINQIRQNIWSTQPDVVEPTPESDMVQKDKFKFMYAAIMETNQIYTDLTGRFPTTSLSGKKYILILYDYDSNSVLSAPVNDRGDKDMVRAFDLLIQSLIIRGLKPLQNQSWEVRETMSLGYPKLMVI